MWKISEGGARADTLLIHVQEKLVVRADMHEKMRGRVGQVEDLVEMKDEGIAFGGVGKGDPLCSPGLGGKVGCELSDEESSVQEQ